MRKLDSSKKFWQDKLPVQIGDSLGVGADGQCFSIVGDSSKAIKVGVSHINRTQEGIDYLISKQPAAYARVYERKYLGMHSCLVYGCLQELHIYYYIMERLLPITDDERKVFHTILSHEDRDIDYKKNYSINEIKKMLEEMRRGLDFDFKKIILFCENIKAAPIEHLDLHPRNILKNIDGHFKLIDFDSINLMEK